MATILDILKAHYIGQDIKFFIPYHKEYGVTTNIYPSSEMEVSNGVVKEVVYEEFYNELTYILIMNDGYKVVIVTH